MTQGSSPEGRYARAMEVAANYRSRQEEGVAEPLEELLARHPDLAELLGAILDVETSVEDPAVPPPAAAASHPDQLGPYRILETLGEGGMGRVYLAEQSEPVQRRVALKLIKLGMDTEQVLQRFGAERQALARMEHDSIAKVYDAGTADTGQPYFVMEYVPGKPLTEYCDERGMSTRERLELFVKICGGVQHAHQKGLIHRDLKPSNILVAGQGGEAVPKIIDFGVAKATDQDIAATLFTEQGQVIGTPEYMSPEQAEMTSVDIDTRADVYALGVILYQLLTGDLPFSREELRRGGLTGIQRKIREDDPPRPSTRITRRTVDTEEIARRRRCTVSGLARELRGDLDWIVMRAMEKDRNRRYATPIGLAEDILRHLNHEPVDAGPPSTTYRLGKFVRRYRLQVMAASLLLVTLVAGIAGTTFWAVEAQTNLANFNLLSNVVKLREAKVPVEAGSFYPAWPENAGAMRRWIAEEGEPLEKELAQLERILKELQVEADDPSPEELEAWRRRHGRYGELSQLREKHASLSRARAVREGRTVVEEHQLSGPLSGDPVVLNLQAWPLVSSHEDGRIWGREAEGLALARWSSERADAAGDVEMRLQAADVLAWALFANGMDDNAIATYERAVELASQERRADIERDLETIRGRIAAARGDEGLQALASVAAEIEALQGEMIVGRFREPADQFLHDALAALVDDLRAFAEPGTGELARVRENLAWAESVQARSIDAHSSIWTEAREAIAAADGIVASELYAAVPIDLQPQLGLVPIGMNPRTLLWEFYHLRSAEDPGEIPTHDEEGGIEVTPETGVIFVLLPGGTVYMGAQREDRSAPHYDPDAAPHEKPLEFAFEPFFLARHEMTQGQWKRLSGGQTPSSYGEGWDRPDDAAAPVTLAHPVESVTWRDSSDLLVRHGLELPGEPQWEYAARGGTSTPWSTGADAGSLEDRANILDATAGRAASQWGVPEDFDDGYIAHAPVGIYPPNGFGLFDVHGNVWEWCRGSAIASNQYMVRGGSFMDDASEVRSSARLSASPTQRGGGHGLRPFRKIY